MPRREPLRSLRTSRRRDTEHPQRLLERLLGRRTDALTNFFTNLGIVLRHLQNGVVFLQREALIGNCLRQGIDGLIRNALLVGGGRRGYALLIIRPNSLRNGSFRLARLPGCDRWKIGVAFDSLFAHMFAAVEQEYRKGDSD
jgi:hypothetical protein